MNRTTPVKSHNTRDLNENRGLANSNFGFTEEMCEAVQSISESATAVLASDVILEEKCLKNENLENQGSDEASPGSDETGHNHAIQVPLGGPCLVETEKMVLEDYVDPIPRDPLMENHAGDGHAKTDISVPQPQNSDGSENKFAFQGTSANHIVPKPVDLIVPNFAGPCKFGIVFPGVLNSRTPSVYMSETMSRVFLRMNTTIVVKFTFDPTRSPSTDLFVRATLKYVDMDTIQNPVERCQVHIFEDDPNNKSHEFEQLCKCPFFGLAGHVLRSSTLGAIYCYDTLSKRHSVMSPLKGRSHDVVYSFHCKSSCPKGINRRAMRIVFTLELLNGAILGQTSLDVKVCSSPKRDRDRSDAEMRSSTLKRKRVYYEEIEPNKETASSESGNGSPPMAMVSHTPTQIPTVSKVTKIRANLKAMEQHLAVASNAIKTAIQCLSTLNH